MYIVMRSDRRDPSKLNAMFKYADDTTLLVPEHTRTDTNIDVEFSHVKAWHVTISHSVLLRVRKLFSGDLERVVFISHLLFDNIEQLHCNNLLEVLLQSNFKMDMHIHSRTYYPNALSVCT